MADLSENDVLSEGNEVSNTDTQEQAENEVIEQFSDAEIDAINEVMTEENESGTVAENETENHIFCTDSVRHPGDVAENTTVEPVGNTDRLPDELFGNSEQLEPHHNPWDDAPKDVYFYEKTYEDGHLGSYTESPEMAYKFGWDIKHNYIPIADTEKSDVNGFTYPKELCPHKSERDKQIEAWNREIFELKEELNATDYKAIKYAEGVMTDEEYQQTGIQRQAWRKRINELERLIAG